MRQSLDDKPRLINSTSIGFALLSVIVAATVWLAVRLFWSERPAEANAPTDMPLVTDGLTTQPQPEVNETTNAEATVPVAVGSPAMAQTVNGVEIRVWNARLEGNRFRIDVCFDRPDNGDWLLRRVNLQFGAADFQGHQGTPIEIRDYPENGQQKVTTVENGSPVERWEPAGAILKGRRCDNVSLAVGSNPDAAAYLLTIDSIRMFPNEGDWCNTYLTQVQAGLDARGDSIVIGCTDHESGSTVTVVSKPDDMSQEEAEAIVSANGPFIVSGPWVFSGEIQ